MAPGFPGRKVWRMSSVDLNADLGEGCGSDEELLHLVSSASIACGAHAGDARTMLATIAAAVERGVSVGAHPGYADRESFGRRETGATPPAIRELILAQLDVFAAACVEAEATFSYVKPHGALYNRAMLDPAAAESIAGAVAEFDAALMILCMPASRLLEAAQAAGLRPVREAFLDRAYESATALVPRTHSAAVITDPDMAAARAERMVLANVVRSVDGVDHPIEADSLCVHGDNPDAVALMRATRARLEARGVTIAPFSNA